MISVIINNNYNDMDVADLFSFWDAYYLKKWKLTVKRPSWLDVQI